jgi:hypothetical protein
VVKLERRLRKLRSIQVLRAVAACAVIILSHTYGPDDGAAYGAAGVDCTAWNELTPEQARHVRSGDFFGPNYPYYMDVSALPADMVSDYELEGTDRYIGTSNGYLFVVDPHRTR